MVKLTISTGGKIDREEWENRLTKFVNLPHDPGPADRAEEFCKRYGELHPNVSPALYWIYVRGFILHWRQRLGLLKLHVQDISVTVEQILNREYCVPAKDKAAPHGVNFSGGKCANPLKIRIDLESGRLSIEPQTTLDHLAKTLLDVRGRLGICARHGCEHPYFIKTYPAQRFCTVECANPVRKAKKEKWWAEHREEYLARWRRERKAQIRKRKKGKARQSMRGGKSGGRVSARTTKGLQSN